MIFRFAYPVLLFMLVVVAEMSLKSMLIVSLLPILIIVFSSSTRKRSICIFELISPISSRNSVPPDTTSKKPFRVCVAPVKEPFLWPKSSLSSNVSGMDPQLMAMKGYCERVLLACIALATSSLPVPVSPVSRTEASLAAILSLLMIHWILKLIH